MAEALENADLVASLVGVWVVLTIVNLILFGIGWAGVLRDAVVLVIVGTLSAIWNERNRRSVPRRAAEVAPETVACVPRPSRLKMKGR